MESKSSADAVADDASRVPGDQKHDQKALAGLQSLPSALHAHISSFLNVGDRMLELARCCSQFAAAVKTKPAWDGVTFIHKTSLVKLLLRLDIAVTSVDLHVPLLARLQPEELARAFRNVTYLRASIPCASFVEMARHEWFRALPRLRVLDLNHVLRLDPEHMRLLASMPALQELRVSLPLLWGALHLEALPALASLPVVSATAPSSAVSLRAFAKAQTPLRELHLGHDLSAEHYSNFAALPVLHTLGFQAAAGPAGPWEHLPLSMTSIYMRLPMTALNMRRPPTAPVSLEGLERLTALRTLSLAGGHHLGPCVNLAPLADCAALTQLELSHCLLTESGLAPLPRCRALTSLLLTNVACAPSGRGFDVLGACTQLQKLLLDGVHQLTLQTAAEALRPLSRLTSLTIAGCRHLDSSCLAALLQSRAPLRELRIRMSEGKQQESDLAALLDAVPRLRMKNVPRADWEAQGFADQSAPATITEALRDKPIEPAPKPASRCVCM